MRVLVTGSEGRIGKVQAEMLRLAGHEVRTLDRKPSSSPQGDHWTVDLRDRDLVRKALEGMDAVAHLGAIPGDWEGHDAEVMEVNVQGTWNILDACREHRIGKAVCFSSIQALGNVCGFRDTLQLPIDDSYARHPMSAYQLSKHLGEEICRSFSMRYNITTVCIRPVGVLHSREYQRWQNSPPDESNRGRVNNYWAYVDVRDVCQATLKGLTTESILHDAFLVAADDNGTMVPTAELVDRFYPETPWRGTSKEDYLVDNPFRSLVDCSHAKAVLGWQPQYTWRDKTEETAAGTSRQ